MYYKNMEKFLKKRNDNTQNQKIRILGTEIKKARLENNQTLSQFAKESLSVSYLSKLENGKVFASDFVLEEILSKIKINRDIFDNVDLYYHLLKQTIKLYFFDDPENIARIFNKINGMSFDMKLIKFIYYIMTGDRYKSIDCSEKIYSIKETLTDLELECFLCFSLIFEINYKDYIAAAQYQNLIKTMRFSNEYLHALNQKSFCLNAFAGKHEMAYNKVVREYKTTCQTLANFSQIIEISYLWAITLASSGYKKTAQDVMRPFSFSEKRKLKKYFILQADYLISIREFSKAFLFLKNCQKDISPQDFTYYSLKCSELSGDVDYIRDNLGRLLNIDLDLYNTEKLIFLRYLEYKYNETPIQLRDFLRNTTLEVASRTGNVLMLDFYFKILRQELAGITRYKDVVFLYKLVEKKTYEMRYLLANE